MCRFLTASDDDDDDENMVAVVDMTTMITGLVVHK
jgi:hypothetical protein